MTAAVPGTKLRALGCASFRATTGDIVANEPEAQEPVESNLRLSEEPPAPGDVRGSRREWLRGLRLLQDRLAHLLGSSNEGRVSLVARMLERSASEATSYWLQLGVSIGIATLGLVIGSVAIIIGAMLVAPLMGPIIALALGLAAGSPYLVLRAASRICLSVVVAVGGAALITVLLPFHQLNAEIAARTSPTVLDLLTAGFCALAGVYASLRPGSDTAATAAGTSIGISLVPPLCASGFGLGTTTWSVAGGAALLFLTNLVAIIFVGTLSFVAAGFNRVDTASLERVALANSQNTVITARIARRLAGLFESGAGPALRFLMPLALLGAIYVPLRQALDEVAWQVRTRAAVDASLRREPGKIVQSRVRVERHEVDLLLVLLGNTTDAEASRARLTAAIEAASGVTPRVEVLAVPDATAFAGLASDLRATDGPIPVPPELPQATPVEQLETGANVVRSSIQDLWPGATAGELLVVDVGTHDTGPLNLRVVHLGARLNPDARETLARSLSTSLGHPVQIVDVAIPSTPLSRAGGDLEFALAVSAGIRASMALPSVNVCVVQPSKNKPGSERRDRELALALEAVLAEHPRVSTSPGEAWSVRFATTACTEPAPSDATTARPAGSPPEH